jgi:hypothetical protein
LLEEEAKPALLINPGLGVPGAGKTGALLSVGGPPNVEAFGTWAVTAP